MRLSRSRYGPLLVASMVFAVIGVACADSDVEPDRTTSVTTGAPATVAPTTVAPSPDGLDCESDDRVSAISEPAPEFAGYATPEEAVLAAGSDVVSGTPKLLEGDTWVIVSDAGLTIARTKVEPWQEGWWAGEILACDTGTGDHGASPTPGTGPAPPAEDLAEETLVAFFDRLHTGQYAEAAELYGGSYETLVAWNPALDPEDHAALLENGCSVNGLQCLYPMRVTLQTSSSETYQFLVEFEEDDGSLFTVGPCCGADESAPPQSQFTYTVAANGVDSFLVHELPPYLS